MPLATPRRLSRYDSLRHATPVPDPAPESGPSKQRRETMTLKDRHPFAVDQLNQMQRYLGEEMIEDYHTGELTRRQMLKRLLGICGSATAAAALLAACGEGTATPPAATAGAAPASAVP